MRIVKSAFFRQHSHDIAIPWVPCASTKPCRPLRLFGQSRTKEMGERTPLLREKTADLGRVSLEKQHLMSASQGQTFPEASFTRAKFVGGRRLPQCIAHRGFKAKHPENTMAAFRAAVQEGRTEAIETDIHLSKDNVVVLSHDPDLKRCFGQPERIIDCDWHFLSQLRTTKAPHESMPRLRDLLEYLAQPSNQEIWMLLDIKLDNNSEDVMRLIAETIASVPSGPRPWSSRIVLGIWAAKYLSLSVKYSPDFPVAYIGFSTCYARQFLKVPNVGFNMFLRTLLGPIGTRFIRDVQEQNQPLFVWTVNDTNLMKWSINKDVDGIITDNPELYNEVRDAFNGEEVYVTLQQWLYTFWLYILVTLFSIPLKHRFPGLTESTDAFLKSREQMKVKASLALGA